MAEPLKHHFGPAVPRRIAEQLAAADPRFDANGFLEDVLAGYEALELMPRAWTIARALRRWLPDDYDEAVRVMLASLGPQPVSMPGDGGMASFLYLPHTLFVAEFGLDHFETSMRAQYELTQRFSAEFSIRRFLERYPDATLARLHEWAGDPSPAVRRLVSEGTRPRLPWAPRLRRFIEDPAPVLALLERLKDDPALVVRRSVANNLNDIGKDHPELAAATARRWLNGATPERTWIVRHALRSAVKRGDAAALSLLGFGRAARVTIARATCTPKRPRIGGSVRVRFEVTSSTPVRQRLLVDFRIHFVKANGRTAAKVFKMKALDVEGRKTVRLAKTVSLANLTTRRHYPGRHRVDVLVNGRVHPLGSFDLLDREGGGRPAVSRSRTRR